MGIFLSGVFAGIMSGLALGGGVLLIAILTYITTYSQANLQTVNLLYYIPTAIFSVFVYGKNRNIDYIGTDIDVDITGCNYLKLTFKGPWNGDSCLGNAGFYQ